MSLHRSPSTRPCSPRDASPARGSRAVSRPVPTRLASSASRKSSMCDRNRTTSSLRSHRSARYPISRARRSSSIVHLSLGQLTGPTRAGACHAARPGVSGHGLQSSKSSWVPRSRSSRLSRDQRPAGAPRPRAWPGTRPPPPSAPESTQVDLFLDHRPSGPPPAPGRCR